MALAPFRHIRPPGRFGARIEGSSVAAGASGIAASARLVFARVIVAVVVPATAAFMIVVMRMRVIVRGPVIVMPATVLGPNINCFCCILL